MSTNSLPSKDESQKLPPLGFQNNGTVVSIASASGPPAMQTMTSAEQSQAKAHAQEAMDLAKAAQPQPSAQSHVPSVLETCTDPVTAATSADVRESTGQSAPSQVKDFSSKRPPASQPTPLSSVLEQSDQENPMTKTTPVAEFGRDVDHPPQLNDGETSVDDQKDPTSNPSGIGNCPPVNVPPLTKGPSLVAAGSSAATLEDDKNGPRFAKSAAAKPIGDESLPLRSKQPPASMPKNDAIANMPTDITQTMDFNAAMIAISKLADQTKPKKTSEPAPTAIKASSASSENKYASLFTPKAGQWDSWQQHVRATAAKQQKAMEAAVAQQQQALATVATQANPIVAVAQANPILAITQAHREAQGMQEAAVAVAATKQQVNISQEPPANTNVSNAAPSVPAAPFTAASPVPAVITASTAQSPADVRQVNPDATVWSALSEAAVLAAEKHLKWNQISKRKRSDVSDLANSFPTHDSAQAKKAKVVKASSSQLPTGHRDERRLEIPGMTARKTVESHYSQQPEERRRSLSLSSGLVDSSTQSVKRRRSSASGTAMAPPGGPFATAMNPTLHTPDQVALLAAALNQQQQQSTPVQLIVPGLSKALQDSPSPSNAPRNADKPMTYLVRQLLGQIPVDRNDPAFVLSPKLVKIASTKVQMVIDKLVEAAVKRTKQKGATASAEDPDAKLPEDVEREIQILSQFSQERAIHLLEQNKTIADLQQKLDENLIVINEKRNHLESLRLRVKVSGGIPAAIGLTDDADHDETVRTLVQKLQRVIATVCKLKKDIDAYQLVAKQDEVELQQKDDVIKLLRAMIETESTLGRQMAREASDAHPTTPQHDDKQKEIALLMKDVENLKKSLRMQRGKGENRMKSYMRAAVQALKKQSGQKSKRSKA